MIVSAFSVLEVYDSGDVCCTSSHEIRSRISSLKSVFDAANDGIVALCMERSSDLICVVATLLEKRLPFIFIRTMAESVSVGAQWTFDGKKLIKLFCHDGDGREENSLCYVVKTSGSTGQPKLVGVPYSCIEPNIDDFRERLAVSEEDVILCSTSIYFDPSIVEMFLAFTCGARLLLVSDNARSQPHILSAVLRRHAPTIVQFTPSVLSLLDESTLSWMLGDLSPIRCLLLGGEKFPLNVLNRFRTEANPTRVFNVYGVTEVSCWASAAEVSYRCSHVGIGTPLRGTTFSVTDDGELLIGGTRRSFINGILSEEFTRTGDIIKPYRDEYIFIGRTDDQVKFNGIRCNLASLSELVVNWKGVSFAQFLLYKDKFLVLFVVAESTIDHYLEEIVSDAFIPSKVIYMDKVPVNSNGKVDRSLCIHLLEEQCSTWMKSSASIRQYLAKFGIKSTDDLSSLSFVDCGVHSTEAAEIALHLGNVDAVHDILSPKMNIADILRKYIEPTLFIQDSRISVLPNNARAVLVVECTQPVIKWACNTGKCIDGSPLLLKYAEGDAVIVASHSGLVVCVWACSGFCRWQTAIATRFEASPELCGDYVVIGGYDGCAYFLSIGTGAIEWCFPTGDAIKAACTTDEYGFAYATSYDRNIYKLDPKRKSCCWCCGILSGSPARVVLWKRNVIVTTIHGSVESVDTESGHHRWTYHVGAPLFSSSTIFNCFGYVSSVDGTITKLRMEDGNKERTVNVDEAIFASVAIFDGLIYAVTERGSLFITDLNLSILRCFRFVSCSFVVPPFRIATSVFAFVSTSGLFFVFSEHDNEARGFRLGQGKAYCRVLISHDSQSIFAGNRDDWLRRFEVSSFLLRYTNIQSCMSCKTWLSKP